MQKWDAITINNWNSVWSAELVTIYVPEAMTLAYNVQISDSENHHQAIFAPENQIPTVYEDGFVLQRADAHKRHLLSRSKVLTRLKLQFLDDDEFLVDEIALPKVHAVAEAATMTENGVLRFPSRYEAWGLLKRGCLPETATKWALFFPESMD